MTETFREALSATLTGSIRHKWIDRVEFTDAGATRYHYEASFAEDYSEYKGRRPLYIEVSAQGARAVFADGFAKEFVFRHGCWAFRDA